MSATALLNVAIRDTSGICWIAKGSVPCTVINLGGADQEGAFTAAETAAVTVLAGETLQELCATAAPTARSRTTQASSRSGFFPATTDETAAARTHRAVQHIQVP